MVNTCFKSYSTDNITELNDLIYPEAKLICNKFGITTNNTNIKKEPEWKNMLKEQIEGLLKQKELLRKEKYKNKDRKNNYR